MSEVFHNRTDAGRKLARQLKQFSGTEAVIIGIPRGGVPVALAAASRLRLPVGIITVGKLPIPWNTEAGFGAVAADGAVVLNGVLVHEVGLSDEEIDAIARGVLSETKRLDRIFLPGPYVRIKDRTAIIVDDGLASGYTMLAAIQSAREGCAGRVVVAVPVASESAMRLVREAADEVICLIESHNLPFAVADYYLEWHDLTNEDVIQAIADSGTHTLLS